MKRCGCAVYPDLSSREMVVPTSTIENGIGVQLETAKIADLLSRMQLRAEPVQGSEAVRVLVPPTRSDVLHACDVMEVSLLCMLTSYCIQPDFTHLQLGQMLSGIAILHVPVFMIPLHFRCISSLELCAINGCCQHLDALQSQQ